MNEQNILESCLDALTQGATVASCQQRYPQLSEEAVSILQAAASLSAAQAQLSPTPEFKRRAHVNLMQRIAAEQRQSMATPAPVVAAPIPARQSWWQNLVAGFSSSKRSFQPIAAALAIVLTLALGSGMVSAAQKALPGSTLYSVKRLSEQTQGLLKQDDIFWHLDLAQKRLDEAGQLQEQGDHEAATAPLADYTETLHTVAELLQTIITQQQDIPQPQRIQQQVSDQVRQLSQLDGSDDSIQAAKAVLALLAHASSSSPETTPMIAPERTPVQIPLPQPTLPLPTVQPALVPTEMPITPDPTALPLPTNMPAMPTATPMPMQPTVPPTMPPASSPTQPPVSPTMPAMPTQAPMPTQMPVPTQAPPTQAPAPTPMPAPTQVPAPTAVPMPTQAPPAPPMSPPSMPSW